ncbi:unnamed protein product [Pylaiella littoralis]
MKQNDQPSKQSLYGSYFGIFEKPSDFRNVLDGCTKDFSPMVMDNREAPSTNIPNQVFWYKAKYGRVLKIGAPSLWAYHVRWFMPEVEIYRSEGNGRRKKASGTVLTFTKPSR